MVGLNLRDFKTCKPWRALSVVALLFVVLIATTAAHAQQQNTALAQGFQTDEQNLAPGALLSLSNSPNKVELADKSNLSQLIGILSEKALIEIDSNSKQVQVVTSGVTYGFVSDINGKVITGDKITGSPIRGIGMKATASSQIIGTAQADLDSVKPVQRIIANTSGNQQTITVGLIPIQVNATFYEAPNDKGNSLPPFLNDIARSVAGKDVSPVRIIVALVLLILAIVSIAILLYSSVRSSIISIGRNPLSEKAVSKSLWQVGLFVFGILLLTVIAIYLILIT